MSHDSLTPATLLVDPLVWLRSRPSKKENEPTHLWAYAIDDKSRLPLRWTTKAAGRMYTHAPSIHSMLPSYRAAVRVPGKLIAVSDWAACDPRIIARDSKDEQLIADLLSGDAYAWAVPLVGDGDKPARKRAKRAINAVLKGGGKPAVTKQGAPEDFVARVKQRWPVAMAYLDRVPAVMKANDFAVRIGERQVVLPEGSRERGSCIAAYFQAHESHALRKVLGSKVLRQVADPILPIHDGIVWAVAPEHVERAHLLIPKAMAVAMMGNPDHPLADGAATLTVGPSWGDQNASLHPSTEPIKRRSEWVREGLDFIEACATAPDTVSTLTASDITKLAVEFAALDESGEFDVRVAAVAAAKGGRTAATLLRKVGKRMTGEVRRYLDHLKARGEAADAIEVKVFERGDHVELGRDLARQLGDHAVFTPAREVRSYGEQSGAWHAWEDEQLRQRACDYAGELREGPKGPVPIHLSDGAVDGIVAQAGTALYDGSWEPGSGIAFANGFMGTDTKLKEHAAEHRVLAEHVVPYGYEPTARPERFLCYLDEVFALADPEDRGERIRFLREHLGASLLGQGAHYHRHPVLVGPGGNGKSVFLLVVEGLFPSACRATSPPHTWGDRFGRAQLQHAKINLVAEVPNKTLVDSESVKGILAGDPVEIERKYKDKVTMRCRAGHVFACNELPPTVDLSDGFFRRFCVVAFERTFTAEEQDADLAESIVATELAGIAAWAIEGYRVLRERGHYLLPRSHEQAVAVWRRSCDSAASWLHERVDVGVGRTSPADLFADYREWAEATKHRPVTSTTFGTRLGRLGLVKGRTKEGRYYEAELRSDVVVPETLELSELMLAIG